LGIDGENDLAGVGADCLLLATLGVFASMIKVTRALLTFTLFLAPWTGFLMAAPPIGGTPPCWPPPCIPIDGGLGLLAAAGAILGGHKAWRMRRALKQGE
jgi:hypothetical protein